MGHDGTIALTASVDSALGSPIPFIEDVSRGGTSFATLVAMDVSELPRGAWIADAVITAFAVLSFLVSAGTWLTGGLRAEENEFEKRRAGREAVSSQLGLSLTASSILLAASFVVIQIGRSSDNLIPDAAVTQVLMAAIAFAFSTAVTIWIAAVMVPLSETLNVSRNAPTNIFSALALFSLLAGSGFFTVALFLI